MRGFVLAAALGVMLSAAPTFAAPLPQAAPATPPAPAAQAPAPPVQRPFPTGTKYAFVNIQRIAAESAAGKTLAGKVQALNQQKVNELNERNKALQAAQQKLEAGASVLSANAAAQLQKDLAYRLEIFYKQNLNTELTGSTRPLIPDDYAQVLVPPTTEREILRKAAAFFAQETERTR